MFLEEILADSKENDGGGGTSPHHICGLVRDYSESDQAYLIELEGLKRTWMQSSSIRIAAAFGREGDDKILPTPVTFEDCVGKQVKVWWEEDGCFYPGVVLETKEQPVHGGERSGKHGTSFGHQFRPVVNLVDGSGSSSKSNGKGEGEEEAKATKLEKAVKVNYPYDNVEEWVPFHSKNLYWIDHQIEVRIPQSYFRETERGGIDREIASKDSNQNTTYDAASSALGWRVAVNGCQYGYVTNSVEVVPTTGKEEEEEEETKVCRVGDGEVRDVKLQILLDSGFLCSKETKMAYPSRLVVQQEGKKGKEEEGLDSDNLLWFQPPQMNFDFFHQLQRKLLENSERKDPEDRTEDVSVQVTYWDPLDSFRSKLVRLSWRYSVFKLCFRVITQGLDLKGEELLQYLSTPDVDGLQDRKELDLRESMIQWPAEILNGIESTSRVESELQKQKQYYLFGSTFAFAPFAGHSIQHPDALAAYGKRIAEGMRILILEFSGELIEEKTFHCRSGIILNEIVSGSFDVLFDSSNASEKITLEENSKQSRMYVDVLGRAGALERTSSCLPFLLPIISGAVEGYFIPSRGLVLCKGYGMSPKDFVHLGGAQIDNDSLRDALDAILVKDCKKTVYHELAGLETISGKQVRVTLGYWLNLHKISFSKTVYWKLWESHKSGLVNSALREPIIDTLKPFAGQPSTDDYLQEQDKANAENHLFLFDTNTNLKGEIQKLKFELFGEGDIEDPVIALLFEEWIQANKTKLSLTVGHKTLSGDLGRVKQMYQQCTLSGRALNLRLDTRKDPALQWYHLLFKQTHEALDLMKDYLSDFEEIQRGKPNWERGHGRSKISSESFANKYYQSIDTIDLLIDIIRYAKAKPTQPPSLFSFERKGSVFQYLFWFAQNIFKVLAVCTRQRANGWLEYLDVSPNGEISRVEKEKVKRDFLHKRKRDQKAQRATAELQKYPKEHEALVQLLTDHLAQHPTELERIKKYVTSQSAHFGAIPERLPKDEEISVLQFYYDKLLEKGPTAKSTSINWLIKYLKGVDYDQMRKSSSIVVITNFLKWVVSLHRWEKTPTSFFKYKAYFPYFWAYARGDFLNNLREEKKRFHSGGKPKKAAEQDNVQTLKSQAMIDEPKPGQGTPITSGSHLKGQFEQGGDPLQQISFDPLLQNESPKTQMSDKEALRSLLSKNPEVTFKEAAPILCTFLPISDEELQSILKNETDNALQVKELLDKDSFLKDSYLSKFNLSPDAKKAMLQCLVDTQRLLFTKEEIELNKKRQAQEENEKPKKRKYKKRVRRTLDQILENPESLVETTRPTCLGCKCLCAVHRRDQKTGKVISWRCRTCCWQGMKAQLLRSSLGQDPGPST